MERYLAGEPVEEELYRAGRILARVMVRQRGLFLPGGTEDDLIQEGLIGFWEAVSAWRTSAGVPFHRLAQVCIARQVLQAVTAANRLKHGPLNEAARLDESAPHSERRPLTYLDLLRATDGDPEECLMRQEEQHEAHVLLLGLCQGLSRLERESLLRVADGQSYAEVAAALGISRKSVDNAVQRARLKLRRRREAMSA